MANKSKDVKSRPAGNSDKFSIRGVDFSNIIEKEKFEKSCSKRCKN